MTDSPFHLSSLCSTPLFGGMDFLGCPVNVCDGNMEITEFLDAGEFSLSSEDGEEVFDRSQPTGCAHTAVHFDSTGLSKMGSDEAEIRQDDSVGSASNWPGLRQSGEEAVVENGSIKEDGKGKRCSLSTPKITSAVNMSRNSFVQNKSITQPTLRPLKGNYSSSKKLDPRNGVSGNYEQGEMADNKVADHRHSEKNGCAFLKNGAQILRTHDKTVGTTSRKQQPEKGWKAPYLVSKQQYLNFVNVRPAWSYKTSRSGSHHKENHETQSYGNCLPKKAKNLQNAHKPTVPKKTKRQAGNSLEGGQRSVAESETRFITAQRDLWIRPLTNSVSLPAINNTLSEPSMKRERTKVKLPSLSSSDSLLKYKGKQLVESLEGKTMKVTSHSKKISRPK